MQRNQNFLAELESPEENSIENITLDPRPVRRGWNNKRLIKEQHFPPLIVCLFCEWSIGREAFYKRCWEEA